jgi:beta-lactamase superfamily II metal-dependent hydrolase
VTPVAAAQTVAHVLPLTTLPLKLHGLQLDINVKPADATHAIEVPQMQRRVVSVLTGSRIIEVVVGPYETKSVQVDSGTVVLRTLAGAEYELEASAASAGAAFEVELLPAGTGMSVMISYRDGRDARRILVDCGDRRTGRTLVERLRRADSAGPIELLVLTHIDDAHIGGAITLLEHLEEQQAHRRDVPGTVREVWFNRPEPHSDTRRPKA